MKAERLFTQEMILGECPVWDDKIKALFWIDISAGQLWQQKCGHDAGLYRTFDQSIGMCCLAHDGSVVVALEKSIVQVNGEYSRVLFDDDDMEEPNNRFNDGKCDAAGRLLIGTMNKLAEPKRAGLYQFTQNEGLKQLFGGVSISNGLDWSPDKRKLYYVDTPHGVLWRYDYDMETGDLHNKTPFIDYSSEKGDFDGCCVDAEGCIWACHWGGFQVSRWDPLSGRKIDTIALPVPNATCCTFGGEKMNNLIITTGVGRDRSVKRDYQLSGSLFVVETDTVGMPPSRFGV